MATYLVTGVNRGIGLALIDQLSQDKANIVIGTVRDSKKAQAVLGLGRSNIHLIEVDFTAGQETIVDAFKKIEELAPNGLDTVIHNAGVLGASALVSIDQYKAEDYLLPFQVNVIGSVKFYKAISPYLYRGEGTKRVAFISSLAGQVSFEHKFHGYGASKAALNYFMRQVFFDNENSSIPIKKNSVVAAIHPGVVDTDMAAEVKAAGIFETITPETSARAIIKSLGVVESGAFISYEGTVLEY